MLASETSVVLCLCKDTLKLVSSLFQDLISVFLHLFSESYFITLMWGRGVEYQSIFHIIIDNNVSSDTSLYVLVLC